MCGALLVAVSNCTLTQVVRRHVRGKTRSPEKAESWAVPKSTAPFSRSAGRRFTVFIAFGATADEGARHFVGVATDSFMVRFGVSEQPASVSACFPASRAAK